MQLLTAADVSAGAASILQGIRTLARTAQYGNAYFLPASVAQQPQRMEAGQQKIWLDVRDCFVKQHLSWTCSQTDSHHETKRRTNNLLKN